MDCAFRPPARMFLIAERVPGTEVLELVRHRYQAPLRKSFRCLIMFSVHFVIRYPVTIPKVLQHRLVQLLSIMSTTKRYFGNFKKFEENILWGAKKTVDSGPPYPVHPLSICPEIKILTVHSNDIHSSRFAIFFPDFTTAPFFIRQNFCKRWVD